jgi:CRISPR-associated protein Cmr4
MHVGNGDASYSIIDNQVQRDVITEFPTINPSSLKGSLRNFLKEKCGEKTVKDIFGDEKKIGTYKIFSAMLLSVPVRSNCKQFYRAICPRIIEDLKNFIKDFNLKLEIEKDLTELLKLNVSEKLLILNHKEDSTKEKSKENNFIQIEGFDAECKDIKFNNKEKIIELFGEDLVLVDDENFKRIIKELPIIARNKLENGESRNLWYEEIVPRETRFYFGAILGKENQEKFNEITEEVIQIGGNATIGYGYCNIKKII